MYKVDLTQSYFPALKGALQTPMTIGDLLRARAKDLPARPALKELTFDGEIAREWTYASLLAESERLARALASRHKKGARIAVFAPNMPEWVLLEFGAAMAGLVLVTVNPAYQKRELKFVLEQSRAEAIYYVDAYRGNPMREIADSVCDEIPAIRTRILLTDREALFEGEDEGAPPQVSPHDPVQIQYTSGTTGFPKGAVLHHWGLVKNAHDAVERIGLEENETVIHNMPLFHTTGCAVILLGFIGGGATLLLAPIFDPAMIARVIERENVTRFFGVPTMIVALIEEVVKSKRDVSTIRSVGCGGAMVAPELVRKSEQVLGCGIGIVYGQTEASPVVTGVWPDDSLEDLTETIGQPLPDVEVSIRDLHTNEVVAIGEQGEICTRGYLVMIEYNDNREATEKAIDKGGWLHTGDLGRMDGRGYLKITGRVKEMIIRGGENLFPAEIENAMLEHDDIAEIAVVGVADEKWGEQVACFMRACGDNQPDAAALKAFIRERLSPQKTPAYWIWVKEWPLTGSGKIQKFKLAESYERGEFEALEV